MRQEQIRVAIIEPVGGHGGMNYYDFGLCSGLTSSGVNVVLHTCDETHTIEDAAFTIRHSYIGVYGKAPSWQRGLSYLRGTFLSLLSAIRENRKICHFHFFNSGALEHYNIILAKLLGRKIVITVHDIESFVDNFSVEKLQLWCFKTADGIIVHNQTSKLELSKQTLINEEKITIIPHGNYLHMLPKTPTKQEARHKLGIAQNAKVLLFFGQIKDVKGLDLLLQAIPELIRTHPDAILIIAGRPWKADFRKYKKIIDKLSIQQSCINHIRYIPDNEVADFYASCDLVVLPYKRIYQSGVVLMAMSYGRPVLASNLPSMVEMITDGETGLLFNTEDIDDLTLKLIRAFKDMLELEKIGVSGYTMIKREFDWNKIGKSTNSLYLKFTNEYKKLF